jgi:TPR repeat protein
MRLGLSVYAEDRARRRAQIPEWETAAEAGDVDAQLKLAWEYARGDVVDQNITAAWSLFDRAAASGQEDALVNRARFLQLRQVPEGVSELRKLAAKGNWKAQFWLAQHYKRCAGRLNQLKAVVWYDRSSKSGNAVAKFAKLVQLVRVAPPQSKVAFLSKAIVEGVSIICGLTRQGEQVELYESLLYRLGNG